MKISNLQSLAEKIPLTFHIFIWAISIMVISAVQVVANAPLLDGWRWVFLVSNAVVSLYLGYNVSRKFIK